MRARDLITELPVVGRSTRATEAIRLIADRRLVGLVVADDSGHPTAIISGIDIARLLLPPYLLGDMSLASVFDDSGVDDLLEEVEGRTIGDLLDDDEVPVRRILTIDSDATLVEITARMVDARAQVALVADPGRERPGFVTLPQVLDAVRSSWADGGTAP